MGELVGRKGKGRRIRNTARVSTSPGQEPRTRLLLRRCGSGRSKRSVRFPLFDISGSLAFPPSRQNRKLKLVLSEQTKPKCYPPTDNRPAMLHLPLAFPPSSSTLLTSWSTITLPLAALLSQLPSLGASSPGRLSCVLGVEVHANCRIRRIWFSNDGKEADEWLARKGLMSELALYAKETE